MKSIRNNSTIVNRESPRSIPLYTIAQAARYVGLPRTTLRDWLRRRKYKTVNGKTTKLNLITPADVGIPMLSFDNLIEAHVLRALRSKEELPMYRIREALDYAQDEMRIDQLLIRKELQTDGKDLFLNKIFELINLNKGGQLAMDELVSSHLKRIEYNEAFPKRLFPFLPDDVTHKVIVIDPRISFGKPVTTKRHISTEIIAGRYDAGENINELAKDYRIDKEEIRKAISYARAA